MIRFHAERVCLFLNQLAISWRHVEYGLIQSDRRKHAPCLVLITSTSITADGKNEQQVDASVQTEVN